MEKAVNTDAGNPKKAVGECNTTEAVCFMGSFLVLPIFVTTSPLTVPLFLSVLIFIFNRKSIAANARSHVKTVVLYASIIYSAFVFILYLLGLNWFVVALMSVVSYTLVTSCACYALRVRYPEGKYPDSYVDQILTFIENNIKVTELVSIVFNFFSSLWKKIRNIR